MRHQFTLELVDNIARAGSIRRAAERIAITPSALNRRLLALEDELGAPLFDRTAKGVRLSAAGELFIQHARRQIADLERVRSVIEDLKGERWGNIRIGVEYDLPGAKLSAAIAAYRKEHQRVNFEIIRADGDSMVDMLSEYEIDLAYVLNPKADPILHPVATAPLFINAIMAPEHSLATKQEIRINDLIYFPLIMPRNGFLRAHLDAAASKHGIKLRPAVESELLFARDEIAANEAIGFEMGFDHADSIILPEMTSVTVSTRDVARPVLQLTQLTGRSNSVAVNRFADLLTLDFSKYEGG
ncbi:LysR family transcriptional regulator [Kordiimonas sp. SCSIO 12610]|uniref:LysR family transcriptional regulator n=1 Tax=Kordiimonas sp. SCSIO 12610 TaxID=2829597 RepID=UPI0021089854|nr:LysR family transcriptional regulator [Kordiimonas sp. SCSIO 12610]UTW55344.1 LysR family transcriptional regulator [Kordiimonas sp. SCSIO 12610]